MPPYRLELDRHPDASIYVSSFVLDEELNRSYSLCVSCRIPELRKRNLQELATEMRGGTARFTIEREVSGRKYREHVVGVVHGILRSTGSHAEQLARGTGELMEESQDAFKIYVGPALDAVAMHKQGCGAFSGDDTYATVILKQLREAVSDRKFTGRINLNRKVDEVVWPVGTSLLDWVQSLCDEAGLRYFFRHQEQPDAESPSAVEEFVLVDTNDGFEQDPKSASDPYKVAWLGHKGTNERILEAEVLPRGGAQEVRFANFDEVGTAASIAETAPTTGDSKAKGFEWGAVRPPEKQDAHTFHKELAELHADREASSVNAMMLRSDILAMRVGRRLQLELSPGDPREYVCIRAHVQASRGDTETAINYNCVSEVVPTTVGGKAIEVLPPALREEPKLSLTVAEVVGEPIMVDNWMRCRFRYLWQEDKGREPVVDVAVMQRMAGRFGGEQMIPRDKDRVVVGHFEDNPRRAVILGCLYDEHGRTPPVMGPPGRGGVLPKSARWLGWSYASIDNGGAPSMSRFAMCAMDVTADHELFYFNAPFDWQQDIGNNCDITIEKDRTCTVKGNETQDVTGNFKQTVTGNANVDVTGNYDLKVTGNGTLDLGNSGALNTKAGMTSTSGGKMLFDAPSFYVNSPSIGFSSRPSVGGGMGAAAGETSFTLESRAELTAPEAVEISSGSSSVETRPQQVTLESAAIQLQSGPNTSTKLENGRVVLEAPDGIVLRCGNTEIELSSRGIEIRGGKLAINMDGETAVTSKSIRMEGDSLSIENEQTRIAAKRLDISD